MRILLAWLLGAVPPAWAKDTVEQDFRLAQRAERERDYKGALAACARVVQSAPDSGRAASCRRRTEALQRRRDQDGSFTGWSTLEEVRASPGAPDRARRVEGVWASAGTSEVTRAEAALWLAHEALSLDQPERALQYTEPYPDNAVPSEPLLTDRLLQLRALALAKTGQAEQALALQEEVAVAVQPEAARPTPVQQELTRQRQQAVAAVCGAVLALFLAGTLWPAWRSRKRLPDWRPLGLLPIGLASLGAFALAEGWEPGAGRAAPWMGLGFALVHLLAALSLSAAERAPLTSLLVRLGAALATFAVAYLALWATGTLAWVGW